MMSLAWGRIMCVEPLLKWAGGKRHIAEVVKAHFPDGWREGTYLEPFAGGAAIFFNVLPRRAIIADVNEHLIGFYQELKTAPRQLYEAIARYAEQFDSLPDSEQKKDMYLSLRSQFNNRSSGVDSAALFYALNKLGFNGLYRENSRGHYNVPFGQKKSMQFYPLDAFMEASAALQGAALEVSDFEQSVTLAARGDFVYFDPPYVPLTTTASFTSYTAEGFGEAAQQRLAQTMRDLAKRGVYALLSNSDTPITREIYHGLRQESIYAPRRVSANSSGRGLAAELLIANY